MITNYRKIDLVFILSLIGLLLSVFSFYLYFKIDSIRSIIIIMILIVDIGYSYVYIRLREKQRKFIMILIKQLIFLAIFVFVGVLAYIGLCDKGIDKKTLIKLIYYGIFTLPSLFVAIPILHIVGEIFS